MAHTVPDFDDLYLSECLSDVTIAINEEELRLGEKRRRGQLLPGHGLVLMGFSSYCKAKLTTWASKDDAVSTPGTRSKEHRPSKHIVELTVPPGQSDIAVCLVKGMYKRQPDCSDLSQEQLLQLLLLADKFGVPKVQVAATEVLKALAPDQLEWQTAIAILDIPDSCAEQEGFKDLRDRAMARLLQRLGDLDRVWVDEQLQQQLLALPHAVLLQLLQHDDTRAASEATIVYTIQEWFMSKQEDPCIFNYAVQLLQQVRMRHLSQLYINTFMMRHDMVRACYSPEELGIASMCTNADMLASLQQGACPELTKYPAWTAAKRPASTQQQVLEWELPMSKFKKLVCSHLDNRAPVHSSSQPVVLQGRKVKLQVTIGKYSIAAGDHSEEGTRCGVFFRFCNGPDGSACRATVQLSIEAVQAVPAYTAIQQNSLGVVNMLNKVGFIAGKTCGAGHRGALKFGAVKGWSDVEAILKERKLLHADGCLHIAAKILELL